MNSSLPEKMRVFVAIPVPPPLIQRLKSLIGELKPLNGDVKWVRPESIHLTLKFLGNVPAKRLNEIFAAVAAASSGIEPFALVARNLGAFPSLTRPRVFWVGFDDSGREALAHLQARIEQAMVDLGFPEENRPFTPHLTLGRVRSPKNLKPLIETFSRLSFQPVPMPVDRVQVMRSQLRREGAHYTVLKELILTG